MKALTDSIYQLTQLISH